MKLDFLKKNLLRYAMNLELILALFLSIGIALGLIPVVKYLVYIFQADIADIYTILKKFLSIALLMVVGIELVLMLLSHSSRSILQLVLFTIARKMLVYSESTLDLIIGTAAIAIVFAIKRYLLSDRKVSEEEGEVVSAASPVNDVIFNTGLHIPENKGVTIGGLICHLSEETCIPVEEGAYFEAGNAELKVLKMKNGLIEKVVIKEKSHEETAHA